jgi:hypothetical protein
MQHRTDYLWVFCIDRYNFWVYPFIFENVIICYKCCHHFAQMHICKAVTWQEFYFLNGKLQWYIDKWVVYGNGIESMWALLKRELHGAYHHVSKKYLHHYVNVFCSAYFYYLVYVKNSYESVGGSKIYTFADTTSWVVQAPCATQNLNDVA